MDTASHARCAPKGKREENVSSQNTPASARNATAQATSVESGLRPTPASTYSALSGLPRCVAEATSPTMATTSGMHSSFDRRARTSAGRPLRNSGAPISANATAPDGASVVNSTSVNSLAAKANPAPTAASYR